MKNLLLLIAVIPLLTNAQERYTLSGKVTDKKTGEDLIGVSVLFPEIAKGTVTNSYGFYSITLPSGKYSVHYSYLGYDKVERIFDLNNNMGADIGMDPAMLALGEVVVVADRDDNRITSAQYGSEKLILRDIEKVPVLFGERDILKTIQLLPGISSTSEGSTGFTVRGGTPGQNLIILDEATVYSSSHLAGFFSVFNSDAIKDVAVYKGGIPASYGGRSSSVIDITMNNGNNKSFSATGGIGLIASRLTLEIPLIKDKMSFIMSGRRTYGDLIAKLLFPEEIVRNDLEFYFYDLNAKLNYTFNAKNRLFLSGYFGKDRFGLGSDAGTGWGNTTGTIRWNHLFTDKLFSKSSLVYSRYDYEFVLSSAGKKFRSGIEDISLKEELTWYLNPDITIKTGMDIIYHRFSPGSIRGEESSEFDILLNERKAAEGALYLQNDHKMGNRFSAGYGIRISAFSQTGPGWFYEYDDNNNPADSSWYDKGKPAFPYFCPEPRISLNYQLNTKSSLKLSYNRIAQYLHLMSNNTAGSPSDIWMPSSNNIKPVIADHISAGYFRNMFGSSVEASLELYYKNISNSADFEDGADMFFNPNIEAEIATGRGRAYGFELFLKKKYGKITGWISYTLSRSENRIEGINNDNWYPVRYDRTNDVSIIATFKPFRRLAISGVWVYATGNAVTFPSGKYIVDNNPVPYYTERNGYRMPAYHRMDLSLSIEGKERKKFKSVWDFSVYNLYNRHNAYMITFRENQAVAGSTEAVRLSLFGIVPAVTWGFKF